MSDIDKLIEKASYSETDVYSELFYKFPIFLISNEKYRDMKLSSKFIYMLLKDRNELSLLRQLHDENKKIFLIFTIEELMKESNLSKSTVISALNELQEKQLLTKRKNGFNKKEFKMYPNFYYLLKPFLEKSDIYEKKKEYQNSDNQSNQHLVDERVRNSDNQSNQRFEDSSKIRQSLESINSSNSKKNYDGMKIRQDLDYTFKDFKDVEDSSELIISSIQRNNSDLEKILIESFIEEYELTQKFGQNVINCLVLVANNDLNTFQKWSKNLEYAIKSAEKEKGCKLNLFEQDNFAKHIQDEIAVKLRMCIRRAKTDHKIKNVASFTFIAIKNLCVSLIEQQIKLEKIN
jgi:DNA-binding transcriptional regulator GbsR (MarR family)